MVHNFNAHAGIFGLEQPFIPQLGTLKGIEMMKDFTGKRCGYLTAIKPHHQNKRNKWVWLFKCDCGNFTTARFGDRLSCGCLKRKNNLTHGMKYTPEYQTWQSMKSRCKATRLREKRNYLDRGINVCEEWKDSFETFFKDMGKRPTPRHQIDRRDNNAGYNKDNCRWVTPDIQESNKRNSWIWIIDGVEYKSRAEALKATRVSSMTLIRWCQGYVDKRDGYIGKPKPNCRMVRKYGT